MLNEDIQTGEEVAGTGTGEDTGTGEVNGAGDERSNMQFIAEMLKLREPQVGTPDEEGNMPEGTMTAEQAALARLEFKDSMRDNMDTFKELLPEATNSQAQSFIEGVIQGDSGAIINAVKNAVMAGIEAEDTEGEPRNLKVEGTGSGPTGKGDQKPANSLSEAQKRMSNMFSGMR